MSGVSSMTNNDVEDSSISKENSLSIIEHVQNCRTYPAHRFKVEKTTSRRDLVKAIL